MQSKVSLRPPYLRGPLSLAIPSFDALVAKRTMILTHDNEF
jgi:hypothetical protein